MAEQHPLPLRHTTNEIGLNLFIQCKYTRRIWTLVANWLAYQQLTPSQWWPSSTVQEWYEMLAKCPGLPKEGTHTLIL
ncbi:hypothetical protein E2562_021788 [Oryza meyeriana var. granulata]|uniref:Uncharacterized protein n=1 Tax=Oryza meyeriana var. granulata TaxID=110450 RepID=A0A6G1EN69_9ORYZ|nr:hypothetical protein E2562_021788 [Oryza meyeriana var. granulata]